MLGKPSRRARKKLESQGVVAPAVVLEIAERGMAVTNGNDSIVADTEVVLKTRLRVEPAGQPTFEVHERFRFPQLGIPGVGATISVRYDPDDHDNIMLENSEAGVMAAMSAKTGLDIGGLMSTIRETKAGHPGDRQAMGDALRAQFGQDAMVFAAPMTMPTAGTGAPAADDPISQIERLAALHASGALSDAEFASEKARVLAES